MRRFSIWTSEYFSRCKNHLAAVAFFAVLVPAVLFICLAAYQRYANFLLRNLTLADFFIAVSSPAQGWSPFCMVLVPSVLFFLMLITRSDCMANYLIRVQTLKTLWSKQCFTAVLTGFFSSVYVVAITTLIGLLGTDSLVNFSQRDSLFAFFNLGATIADPPALLLVLVLFAYCFCMSTLMGIGYFLLRWLLANTWLPFVLIVFIGIFDSLPMAFKLIYYRVSVGYLAWLYPPGSNLWLPVVLIICLCVVGYVLIPKTEFLDGR